MDSIPAGARRHRPRLRLERERGLHAGRHQHGRRVQDGAVSSSALPRLTADRQCIGAGKLVVFCNAVEDNPFMAGAFHGSGEADDSGERGRFRPRRRARACWPTCRRTPTSRAVAEAIKATAFKITRAGELMAREASPPARRAAGHPGPVARPHAGRGRLAWPRSWRPSAWVSCGGPGTTAALALLNDAVKKGGVMASVVGGRPVRRVHPRVRRTPA